MAQIKVIGAIKMISPFGWILKTIVLKSVADDLLMVFNGSLNKLWSTLNDPLVKYIKGKIPAWTIKSFILSSFSFGQQGFIFYLQEGMGRVTKGVKRELKFLENWPKHLIWTMVFDLHNTTEEENFNLHFVNEGKVKRICITEVT